MTTEDQPQPYNPNLHRYTADALIDLEHARNKPTATHVHAGVRVGVGRIETGPVVDWSYDVNDHAKYGWIEIVNYKGDHLIKPFTDISVADIRPCWDRCKHAPDELPSGKSERRWP